jgi:hypothetical protein
MGASFGLLERGDGRVVGQRVHAPVFASEFAALATKEAFHAPAAKEGPSQPHPRAALSFSSSAALLSSAAGRDTTALTPSAPPPSRPPAPDPPLSLDPRRLPPLDEEPFLLLCRLDLPSAPSFFSLPAARDAAAASAAAAAAGANAPPPPTASECRRTAAAASAAAASGDAPAARGL